MLALPIGFGASGGRGSCGTYVGKPVLSSASTWRPRGQI